LKARSARKEGRISRGGDAVLKGGDFSIIHLSRGRRQKGRPISCYISFGEGKENPERKSTKRETAPQPPKKSIAVSDPEPPTSTRRHDRKARRQYFRAGKKEFPRRKREGAPQRGKTLPISLMLSRAAIGEKPCAGLEKERVAISERQPEAAGFATKKGDCSTPIVAERNRNANRNGFGIYVSKWEEREKKSVFKERKSEYAVGRAVALNPPIQRKGEFIAYFAKKCAPGEGFYHALLGREKRNDAKSERNKERKETACAGRYAKEGGKRPYSTPLRAHTGATAGKLAAGCVFDSERGKKKKASA